MKYRDIPWHFRAASTLGSNAQNLNAEIENAFRKAAIDPTRENTIKRRCETDAIEFGAYNALRWLLEIIGIKFKAKDPSALNDSDSKNHTLKHFGFEAMTHQKLDKIEKLRGINFSEVYATLSQFGTHPTKTFCKDQIAAHEIDKVMEFVKNHLQETIYKGIDFDALVFRTPKEDKEADTKPHISSISKSI